MTDFKKLQNRYLFGGLFILPFVPLLFLQGQYTRFKVGRLPDAKGEPAGIASGDLGSLTLLVIGESTVAGVGVDRLEQALGGRFAEHLSDKTGAAVRWHALGVSGITVKRTIRELVPQIPEKKFDVVVVALGGNDVFALRSPRAFRNDMIDLITSLRKKSRDSKIFLANVPMVRDFIAFPNPLRYVLSRLAKLHHFNVIDMIADMRDVYYFDDVKRVEPDFFSDGVHPSAKGYDIWAREMAESFLAKSTGGGPGY